MFLPVYEEKSDTHAQWVLLKYCLLLAEFKFPIRTANKTCLNAQRHLNADTELSILLVSWVAWINLRNNIDLLQVYFQKG